MPRAYTGREEVIVAVGVVIVTVAEAVAVQPPVKVTVTSYMVVNAGVTVTGSVVAVVHSINSWFHWWL